MEKFNYQIHEIGVEYLLKTFTDYLTKAKTFK